MEPGEILGPPPQGSYLLGPEAAAQDAEFARRHEERTRLSDLEDSLGQSEVDQRARQLFGSPDKVHSIPKGGLVDQPKVAPVLPTEKQARKDTPLATGVLDYFPAALAEVARVSKAGNDKHNPGEPLHWARGKSMDHADAIARHLLERGTRDPDNGMRHTAELAWRALALLQEELEADGAPMSRGSKKVV